MQPNRIRAYIWEFPVRFTHWMNAVCIVTFCITGFYIGHPYMHAISSNQYIMGWMRFFHFMAGYIFLLMMIIRIYWMFAGNKYASWRVFIPLTGRQWEDMISGLKFYLFMRRQPPYAAGHSAMASITYLGVFVLFLFEIASGFALYSMSHLKSGILWILGGWMLSIIGPQTVRLLHHIVMWLLIVFTAIHVYIGWYLDIAEKNGVMGSIFGGYKFISGKEWE
jgi:Ni/Fe-hydrogenase 1 B-type cytochrome subunit